MKSLVNLIWHVLSSLKGCEPGTYNDLPQKEACLICPAGYYCPANTTFYNVFPCPKGKRSANILNLNTIILTMLVLIT